MVIRKVSWPYVFSVFSIVILGVAHALIFNHTLSLRYQVFEANIKNVYEYAEPNMIIDWEIIDEITLDFLNREALFINEKISQDYVNALKSKILNTNQVKNAFDTYFNKFDLPKDFSYRLEINNMQIEYLDKIVNHKNSEIILNSDTKTLPATLTYKHQFRSDYLKAEIDLFVVYPSISSYIFHEMMWVLILSAIAFILIAFVALFNLKNWMFQKRSLEIKDDLISNISHELKTPLTNIRLANKSIYKNISLSNFTKAKELSLTIDRQNIRLQRLIDNLLGKAIMNQGPIMRSNTIEINQFFSEFLGDYTKIFPDIQFHFDSKVKTAILLVDRFFLESIFHNLIENAIKYNSTEISITTRVLENKNIQITVSDNGDGFKQENAKIIFNKFKRLSNDDDISGLGLGLYQVKEILHALNGSIEAKSKKNHGSNFIITIPNK